ncbi:unnamed protein product, partial [Hymenolepis diminuta]|uniref:Type III polyketide synthase n=1 Tax=Hymenolepis diminuta TaxID=6216 RepID=A0A0R3SEG1_HYMDI
TGFSVDEAPRADFPLNVGHPKYETGSATNNELPVTHEECWVLPSDALQNLKANREKMTPIIFEIFNVPATCLAIQKLMSPCAGGKTTDIVLDFCEGGTHSMSIYEGYSLPHGLLRPDFTD